jgi:beta-phosphoglucomutase
VSGEHRIETLIFDYDGVIADTEPLHWRSWAKILAPLGVRFTWELYCEFGRGVHDARMIQSLRERLQEPEILRGLEEKNELRKGIMRELCVNEPPINERTIEMLRDLKGFRLGLVTSSVRSEVEPVLRAAGVYQCFGARVFGDDVERHKPAPDPYLLLGSQMGITTGLVFEDSAAGIMSAQQAGYTVIPVTEPDQLPRLVYREIAKQRSV